MDTNYKYHLRNSRPDLMGGYEWNLFSKKYRKEHPLCEVCLKEGRTSASDHVDHINPLAKGGTDELDNLQAICFDCHKEKTGRENAKPRGYDYDEIAAVNNGAMA